VSDPNIGAPVEIPGATHLYSGKVRDLYQLGDDLLMVASDRVSVYDRVFPTTIEDKGRILTALSLFWFDQVADVVDNHVISTDVPDVVAGRALRCRRLTMLPVECVARGYLTGGGLTEYNETGSVSGIELEPGLVDGSRFTTPLFTPSTKAPQGQHDLPIGFDAVVDEIGTARAERARQLTLAVYARCAERSEASGLILADTKIELGFDPADPDRLVLADEVGTPDSSRFWPAESWAPGKAQESFDKQVLRDWLRQRSGFSGNADEPMPAIPPDVVELTRERYLEAYRRLTGTTYAG
jgi:phosphoribosylaminoimidazole-succinocarboxamide synthase